MIIAFEGQDGAGKTTHSGLLAERLAEAGSDVLTLRLYQADAVESMLDRLDRTVGIDNRSALFCVLSKLLARDEWVVQPALERGTTVLYDKFTLTLLAGELLRGANPEEFAAACAFITPPDVVFLFTVDPAEALRRKGKLPDYRESGLDLDEEAGTFNVTRFLEGDFDEEWLVGKFTSFQARVRDELRRVAADEDLRTRVLRFPKVVAVPTGLEIANTAAFIDQQLAEIGADRLATLS
jgi:thymidylate kinase